MILQWYSMVNVRFCHTQMVIWLTEGEKKKKKRKLNVSFIWKFTLLRFWPWMFCRLSSLDIRICDPDSGHTKITERNIFHSSINLSVFPVAYIHYRVQTGVLEICYLTSNRYLHQKITSIISWNLELYYSKLIDNETYLLN